MLNFPPRVTLSAVNFERKLTHVADYVLPFALAFLFFGQLSFLALDHYTGIRGVARVLWVVVVCSALLSSWRRRQSFSLMATDLYFFTFFAYVLISFLLRGLSPWPEFIYNLLLYGVMPYAAARCFDGLLVRRFLISAVVISVLMVALGWYGYLSLPVAMYQYERPILFESTVAWELVRGFSPIFFSIPAAVMLVLGMAFLTTPGARARRCAWDGRLARALRGNVLAVVGIRLLTAVGLLLGALLAHWLLMRIGLRAGTLNVLILWVWLLLMARWSPVLHRLGLALLAVAAVWLTYSLQPESRMVMLDQLWIWSEDAALNSDCMVAGNSIAMRIAMLEKALMFFLQAPMGGIGSSNYGHFYCSKVQAFASPHMSVAHVLSELGVLGGLFYVGLLWSIAAALWKYWQQQRMPDVLWMAAALWLYVVMVAQMHGNYFMDFHVYGLTGMLAAFLQQSKRRGSMAEGRPAKE